MRQIKLQKGVPWLENGCAREWAGLTMNSKKIKSSFFFLFWKHAIRRLLCA